MAKENFGTQTVTFMKENGLMIRQTGKVLTIMAMAQVTKANGETTFNTVRV